MLVSVVWLRAYQGQWWGWRWSGVGDIKISIGEMVGVPESISIILNMNWKFSESGKLLKINEQFIEKVFECQYWKRSIFIRETLKGFRCFMEIFWKNNKFSSYKNISLVFFRNIFEKSFYEQLEDGYWMNGLPDSSNRSQLKLAMFQGFLKRLPILFLIKYVQYKSTNLLYYAINHIVLLVNHKYFFYISNYLSFLR